MQSIDWEWGHCGPNWEIDKTDTNIVRALSGPGFFDWSCIYSVNTFNSNTYQKVQIKLKIKERYQSSYLPIGIINNFQHKATGFWTPEIPDNTEMKIKKNMYYCLNSSDGMSASHITNHDDVQWTNKNLNFSSGDILSLSINFSDKSISVFKNNTLIGKMFKNVKDLNDNINWRLVVASARKDDCVELISCSGIKIKQLSTKREKENEVKERDAEHEKHELAVRNRLQLQEKEIQLQKLKAKNLKLKSENIFLCMLNNNNSLTNLKFLQSKIQKYNLLWNEKNSKQSHEQRLNCFEIGKQLIKLSIQSDINNTTTNTDTNIYVNFQDIVNDILDPFSPKNIYDDHSCRGKEFIFTQEDILAQRKIELLRLMKMETEIDSWINDTNSIKNINFNNISNDYLKSVEISQNRNKNRLNLTTNSILDIFQTKMFCEEEIARYEKSLQETELEISKKSTNIFQTKTNIKNLQKTIDNGIKKYIKTAKVEKSEEKTKKECLVILKDYKQSLNTEKKLLNKCEELVTKCNQFNIKTQEYTKEMKMKRSEALDIFESKWLNWNYNDIVFWFKIKLGYFDAKYKITNNNNNNEESKDEKENELDKENKTKMQSIVSIDFDNVIYKNLESQQIRSKYLSVLNRSDFRNLGFELFEHQCKLQNSFKKLIEKYPMPLENDSDDGLGNISNYQIEGLSVAMTGNGPNNNSDDSKKYNNKYICPITNKLMKFPVIAYDGCVYEKEAIINYLRQHHTTPKKLNSKLKDKQTVENMIKTLFPHYQLMTQIETLQD